MSDNFSSTSPRGTLDSRIASINSSLSFSIDDIDVDELLRMTPDEVEQQAAHLAQAVETNRYADYEDRHGPVDQVVPVASEPGPSQSGLSILSSAASALASRGGDGGNAARQVDAERDQGSLNPGVYTAWRSGEPVDRDLHTPEPMYLEPSGGTTYISTPPECITPPETPPEMEGVEPSASDQALSEKDETTALGRRKRRLVIRESVLAKAYKSKVPSEAEVVDVESHSEDSQITKRGKSNVTDIAEVQKRKVLRQRQARRRKTKLAAKGRLMDMSKRLRKEMGMINLIQGEVECPGCGMSVILKASMDKVNEEEKEEIDLTVE